jgi:hypothetical protein
MMLAPTLEICQALRSTSSDPSGASGSTYARAMSGRALSVDDFNSTPNKTMSKLTPRVGWRVAGKRSRYPRVPPAIGPRRSSLCRTATSNLQGIAPA